jgi:hypothetical protein
MDKKQWEVNLTRGIAYRHGLKWRDDNAKNMKVLLKDFKVKKLFFVKFLTRFSKGKRCSNNYCKF